MSEEKKEVVFVDGMRWSKPMEGTPDFVKGKIGVKVSDNILWMLKNTPGVDVKNPAVLNFAKYIREAIADEWLNYDLKVSQKGPWYLQLNTWKPTKQDDVVSDAVKKFDEESVNPEEFDF